MLDNKGKKGKTGEGGEGGGKNLGNSYYVICECSLTGCISTFASLVGIPIGITSSAIGFKNLCNNCRNWKI